MAWTSLIAGTALSALGKKPQKAIQAAAQAKKTAATPAKKKAAPAPQKQKKKSRFGNFDFSKMDGSQMTALATILAGIFGRR